MSTSCTLPRAARMAAAGLLTAVIGSPISAQSTWTDLGCELPGATGAPTLTGTGTLEPLSSNAVHLDDAAPSALAMLFLALEQNPVAFKGGVLKPVPFVPLPLMGTTPGGEIDIPFTWPTGLPESLPFYLQFAVQDAGAPVGVALSNAMRGVTPGPAFVESLSTDKLDVGDALTLEGANFGNDPDDICILLHDDQGQTVGFTRAQSVDGNLVTTDVGAIRPGATTANVVLNVGSGAIVPPTAPPAGVTFLNGGSWVFSADPSNMVMVDQEIELFPEPRGNDASFSGQPNFYSYLYSTLDSGGWLELEMPQGDCPPGTTFTFQLDACSTNGTVGLDYYVALQNNTTLDALTCATMICQEFQLAVLNQLGILVTCIPVQNGSDIFLRILPPPGEQWKSWSGAYFQICFPAVACEDVYGQLESNGLIEIVMPTSVPDGAACQFYVEGFTDLGTYAYDWDSVFMPAGPVTPLQLATAVADEIQDAFDDLGVPATAQAATVGTDVIVQLWAPLFETWTYGWGFMQICELQ